LLLGPTAVTAAYTPTLIYIYIVSEHKVYATAPTNGLAASCKAFWRSLQYSHHICKKALWNVDTSHIFSSPGQVLCLVCISSSKEARLLYSGLPISNGIWLQPMTMLQLPECASWENLQNDKCITVAQVPLGSVPAVCWSTRKTGHLKQQREKSRARLVTSPKHRCDFL